MSKLTIKNFKGIKNYLTKHTAKETATKYGLGMATVYLIKRNETFEDYKKSVADSSRRARERKAFVDSFNQEEIIDLHEIEEPVKLSEDQKDFILAFGLVLMAIIGLSYVLVRIIL